jgi:hypothetical protein
MYTLKNFSGLIFLFLLFQACSPKHKQQDYDVAAFYWPAYHYEPRLESIFPEKNGEWEIKPDAGGVLQYGIWEYRDGNIIWRIKSGSQVVTDVNPLVSVTAQEFRLREGAQVTVFTRLN